MTLLDINQKFRSTNLYVKLQKQPKEWFEKNGIELCAACHGTGLRATKLKQGGYSWDGVSNCDDCYGIGYLNIRRAMGFDDDEKCSFQTDISGTKTLSAVMISYRYIRI